MKLWVDDERPAPQGWIHARTLVEALYYLFANKDTITHIALDHDLGNPERRDADVIAELIEALANDGKLHRLEWQILSSNPSGRTKIRLAMERADVFWKMWCEIDWS